MKITYVTRNGATQQIETMAALRNDRLTRKVGLSNLGSRYDRTAFPLAPETFHDAKAHAAGVLCSDSTGRGFNLSLWVAVAGADLFGVGLRHHNRGPVHLPSQKAGDIGRLGYRIDLHPIPSSDHSLLDGFNRDRDRRGPREDGIRGIRAKRVQPGHGGKMFHLHHIPASNDEPMG